MQQSRFSLTASCTHTYIMYYIYMYVCIDACMHELHIKIHIYENFGQTKTKVLYKIVNKTRI